MDAIWFGIAGLFEFIFDLIKPIGRALNILFLIAGIVGTIFWLWYDKSVDTGSKNFMAKPGGKTEVK